MNQEASLLHHICRYQFAFHMYCNTIYMEKHGWMQVDLHVVEKSPPATPVAQIDWGPDFMRPESLCPGHLLFSSHWCNRVDTISVLSSSVQSLPAAGHWNRGVYELEAWNDASPVGTVYLQLEFVCHQLKRGFCGKIFFFLSENECFRWYGTCIFCIFSETQTPSYRACYILHFWGSYFTSVIGVVCRNVTRGLLHGDFQQNQ